MKIRRSFLLILYLFISLFSCKETLTTVPPVNYNVHTFYYSWYGIPEVDGAYNNWNHPIIPHWVDSTWNNLGSYPGGDDIGANYFPQIGCYSSNDPEIIDLHMQQIRQAGIGVVAVSWWGKDSFSNKSIGTYLDIAHDYGLKIAFHIEPIYKTTKEFKGHLEYILDNYSEHPAFYKLNGKPFYYLYNSYKLNYQKWQSILKPDSTSSIRNTPLDGIVISLWTLRKDGEFALVSGFDGVYTYYASDGFHFGCTTSNWPKMAEYAEDNDLIFVPCVGPGYLDTRIRPWNEKNTRSRDKGAYYEKMFMKAINTNPDFIGITSFNEWHEGTQIEPAVPKKLSTYTYEDYGENTDPLFYIHKTRALIIEYEKGEETSSYD
jgi:glycoprotein endo-alpha-1,2-mannosidase